MNIQISELKVHENKQAHELKRLIKETEQDIRKSYLEGRPLDTLSEMVFQLNQLKTSYVICMYGRDTFTKKILPQIPTHKLYSDYLTTVANQLIQQSELNVIQ